MEAEKACCLGTKRLGQQARERRRESLADTHASRAGRLLTRHPGSGLPRYLMSGMKMRNADFQQMVQKLIGLNFPEARALPDASPPHAGVTPCKAQGSSLRLANRTPAPLPSAASGRGGRLSSCGRGGPVRRLRGRRETGIQASALSPTLSRCTRGGGGQEIATTTF